MKCAWNLEKENRNCQYCTVEGCEDRVATKVWSAASLGGLVRIHDSITYIRKDALLEWASRLKEKWEEPPMSRHSPGCVYMLEQLINKLNSM